MARSSLVQPDPRVQEGLATPAPPSPASLPRLVLRLALSLTRPANLMLLHTYLVPPRGDLVPPRGDILPSRANIFPAGGDHPSQQRGALRLPLWEATPSSPRGVLPARGNRLAAHRDGFPPRQGLVPACGDVCAPRGEPAAAGEAGRPPERPKGPMKCCLPWGHKRAMALGQGRIASSSQPACCQVDRSSLVSWK